MTALEPAPFVDPPDQPLVLPTVASHVHLKRDIIPLWMRDVREFKALVIWLSRYRAHATAFHATRSPIYAARLLARSPIGLGVVIAAWWRWVFHLE